MAGIFSSLVIVKKRPEQEQQTTREQQTGPTNYAAQIPVSQVEQAGSPYVYINLTDLRGKTELRLRYVSLEDHKVMFQTNLFPVTADSPLDSVEAIVPFPKLPLVPCTYALELLSGDEPLGACRITVIQRER